MDILSLLLTFLNKMICPQFRHEMESSAFTFSGKINKKAKLPSTCEAAKETLKEEINAVG